DRHDHILRQLHEDIIIHGGLSCDAGAAKLGLRLGEPHLRILDPELRKFNGNMSNLCRNGGGSLGGQRGDDCRVDLGLQDCSGFRHPKKNGNVAWSWRRRWRQLKRNTKN
ncbi:MAG: hypothetical protein ACK53Y_03050, partial [bacterium]